MSGNYENLVVERKGPVGRLILNRSDAINALNITLLDELRQAWAELDVRRIVRPPQSQGTPRPHRSKEEELR